MLNRQDMIRYIRGEGDWSRVISAPDIGARYACNLYNDFRYDESGVKRYKLEPLIRMAEDFDFSLLVPVGADAPVDGFNPALRAEISETPGSGRSRCREIRTITSSHGPLTWVRESDSSSGAKRIVSHPLSNYPFAEQDYRKFEWYVEQLRKAYRHPGYRRAVHDNVARARRVLGDKGLLFASSGYANCQCAGLMDAVTLNYHVFDSPEKHHAMAEQLRSAQNERLRVVLEADVDMIRHITMGLECTSENIFREFVMPECTALRERIHAAGKLLFVHCCGKTKKLIERGYYDTIAPDLFETLSAPPIGTIDDLPAIRKRLGRSMCTRGNLNLDLLRRGTPDQVTEAVRKIVQDVAGYRHFLGTSDYSIFPGTPHENVEAMLRAARTCTS